MRNALVPSLFAICAIAAFAPVVKAADGCVAYGDDSAEFTWRLCPAGEKYERRYIYFGVWSNFYRVKSDAGACRWSAVNSRWVCPDTSFRCDAKRCGAG